MCQSLTDSLFLVNDKLLLFALFVSCQIVLVLSFKNNWDFFNCSGWFNVDEEHNTNVYVSGLPFDITLEEFKEMMSKYGLIMFDPRTKQPKLKLYMDDNGQPKGDGRCCFIKVT